MALCAYVPLTVCYLSLAFFIPAIEGDYSVRFCKLVAYVACTFNALFPAGN